MARDDDEDDEIDGKTNLRYRRGSPYSYPHACERICAERWGTVKKIALGILGLLGTQVAIKLVEFVHFGPPIPPGLTH